MLVALRRFGFFTESVSTASEALFALSHKKFDLLITDIKMPECNGITLANIVHELHPDLKIIFMSSFDFYEVSNHDQNIQNFPFFQKPVDLEKLYNLIVTNL